MYQKYYRYNIAERVFPLHLMSLYKLKLRNGSRIIYSIEKSIDY